MNADQPQTTEPDQDPGVARLRAEIARLASDPALAARVDEVIGDLDEGADAYRSGQAAVEAGEEGAAESGFRRAAERGHPEAAYDLAVALLRRSASSRRASDAVPTEELTREAAAWLLEAEAQGVLAPEDVEGDDRRLLVVDLWLKARIAVDPTGPDWNRLSDRLTRYAYRIMQRWIQAGVIRARAAVANQGGPVLGLGRVPEGLRLDGDAAAELAGDIVMAALRTFRSNALPSWEPARGKDLRSYFVGYCLMKLPDAHRSWYRREVASRREMLSLDEVGDVLGEGTSVEDIVVTRDVVARVVERDPLLPVIVRMMMAGYRLSEIDEKLRADGWEMPDGTAARVWKHFVRRLRASSDTG
jgi:hypothetical protein